MFSRFRRLRISLAAKCVILYGAAVVLIIGAALFVPWRRMEDLMQQLDDRAAFAVADQAVMQHMADEMGRTAPVSAPATRPSGAATRPIDILLDYEPPRLIGINANPRGLNRFERDALQKFVSDANISVYPAETYLHEGVRRYRYARALRDTQECLACHAPDTSTLSLGSLPATLPTQPPRLLGMVSVDIRSQVDDRQASLNRDFIVVAGVLAGTLAIAVFYFITTRVILEPVRVLQDTAEKVSQGDLNIRSHISTGDEFQQLSETFNTMLSNLKQSSDQLRLLNKNLDLKLGQLAETNVALYESNRLKSEFLANVSHELRTPLNSILGFAELLKDNITAGLETKSGRYLQNILTSGRNLLDLINDLLDLAKIEAGKMEVRSEPLSLPDVFEGLSSVLKPLSEAKNLTVSARVAADVPIIFSDPAKLQQVLYNFLSNAIKFSPTAGRVEVSAVMEGDSVRISVVDQGPGIEPEMQLIIFEKFRQIDGGVTRQHGGTGLGLAIARELTTLLGGEIGVRSVPGQGATFWIILPPKIQSGLRDVRDKMELS
ncbi:MAG TPA: HAMP domain-containing sensor histidine kinase [Tepidisphaeraceae bacterium]|nr:HAMP domain-containing sensor histidine kinase [Tepidisphaeraceae bacterium]